MKGIGLMTKDKEKEFKFGHVDKNMKGTGLMIKDKAKDMKY